MTKAKTYAETPLDSWNTRHFQQYLADEHVKHYGIKYVSIPTIAAEASLIGRYAGTTRKRGEYSPAVVKRFIDICFAEYKPNARYPGLNFAFMQKYMKHNFQRAELDVKHEAQAAEATSQITQEMEDLSEWL